MKGLTMFSIYSSVFMKDASTVHKTDRKRLSGCGNSRRCDRKENSADSLASADSSLNLAKIYSFDSLNHLPRLAHILNGFYHGCKFLYKDGSTGRYFLIVTSSSHTPEEFNKLCNCLSNMDARKNQYPPEQLILKNTTN